MEDPHDFPRPIIKRDGFGGEAGVPPDVTYDSHRVSDAWFLGFHTLGS